MMCGTTPLNEQIRRRVIFGLHRRQASARILDKNLAISLQAGDEQEQLSTLLIHSEFPHSSPA